MQRGVEYTEPVVNYLQPACTQIELMCTEKQIYLSHFTLNITQKNEGAEDTKYLQGS